jgi:hypothetical protein
VADLKRWAKKALTVERPRLSAQKRKRRTSRRNHFDPVEKTESLTIEVEHKCFSDA